MKQWAVWARIETDGDGADWFDNYDAAFEAWHKLAQTIPDGGSAYMQRFDDDGDPDENFPHELLRDGADILEYYGGERQWA